MLSHFYVPIITSWCTRKHSVVRVVFSPLSVIFSSDLQGAVRAQEVVWVSVVLSLSVLVKLAGNFKVAGEIKYLPDIIQIVVDTN